MKILKKKILKAREFSDKGKQKHRSDSRTYKASKSQQSQEQCLSVILKNASKNYGRAICNFILSAEAKDTYNKDVFSKFNVDPGEFLNYILEKKEGLNGIKEFRALLLITPNDDEKLISFKKAFQQLSVIFIKYFSVNWIFSGKLSHKMEYLRCRYKMLRRVQNPQYFTYFK